MTVSVVYKYRIPVSGRTMELPVGAKVLTAGMQHGEPHLWALVDPRNPSAQRGVFILGTGHERDVDGYDYVDTFMINDGAYVFHVFVEREQ